jgi:hypothetical protein
MVGGWSSISQPCQPSGQPRARIIKQPEHGRLRPPRPQHSLPCQQGQEDSEN